MHLYDVLVLDVFVVYGLDIPVICTHNIPVVKLLP